MARKQEAKEQIGQGAQGREQKSDQQFRQRKGISVVLGECGANL